MSKYAKLPDVPLKSQYVGITAINRFVGHLSASRCTLVHNQLQQKITIRSPDITLNQTGIEKGLADSTFGTRIPEDSVVLAVHRLGNKNKVWRTCILYREELSGVIGHVEIKEYHTLHSRLGYINKHTQAFNTISAGTYLSAGTVLTDTPGAVDGTYAYGKNLNLCLGSFAGVAEDAFIISDEAINGIQYDTIEHISFKVQPNQILLSVNNGKLLPEPGDAIRKDNIIAVLRNIDPDLVIAQMSPKNLKTIDYVLDEIIEVQSCGDGVIVDMSVICDNDKKLYISDTFEQLDRIAAEQIVYYRRILKTYRDEVNSEHVGKMWSPGKVRDAKCNADTTAFMVRLSMICEKRELSKNKIKLVQKEEMLAPYTIDIYINKTRTSVMGSKLTDLSTSKGVVCEVWPAANMPVDSRGVRADMIASQTASMGRNIVGRLFGQYFDGIAEDVARKIATAYNVNFKARKRTIRKAMRESVMSQNETAVSSWDYMMGMYKLACPTQYDSINQANPNTTDKLKYLTDVVHYGGAILTQTVDNMYGDAKQAVLRLEGTPYAPPVGPVTYVNHNGETVTTKNNIRIAPIYIIPLERDGSETSATDTIRLQSQLFTSTLSKSDKFRAPMAASNVSLLGIDEAVLISSAIAEEGLAEFIDRLNSPLIHANMVDNIMRSDNPTGEYTLVDREAYGWGTTTANRTLTHVLNAYGSELHYEDEE